MFLDLKLISCILKQKVDKIINTQRIADALTLKGIEFEEKKMFGGVCFLVDDKMLAGANRDAKLLLRVDPAEEEQLLQREGVSLMEQSGRSMHGFLYVEPEGFESDEELNFWLDKCLEYNPKAKSSKKKK